MFPVCPALTWGGLCTPCGECLNDLPCDQATGHCPKGCVIGWQPPLCSTCMYADWKHNAVVLVCPPSDGNYCGTILSHCWSLKLFYVLCISFLKFQRLRLSTYLYTRRSDSSEFLPFLTTAVIWTLLAFCMRNKD